MTGPRASVVIPLYNHALFAEEAVRSVLAQDSGDVEVVVVDDGSKDDSAAVVERIQDPRIRLYRQSNLGAHAAINRGLAEARGQFLAVLNSDDRFAPGRIQAALDVFDRQPEVGLVGSWINLIDESGRSLGVKHGYQDLDPWPVPDPAATFKADHDLRTALLLQNYWATTSNFVFRRSTFERHGPFRPLRFAHDWDFALRVQRDTPAHLIEKPLVDYRIHGSNTIRTDRPAMVFEVCWILATHVPGYLDASFWSRGEEVRARNLLRSVHVYGCDKVLWALTAHIHQGPEESALRLLDPSDAARRVYVAEIERILASTEAPSPAPGLPTPGSGLFGRLRAAFGRPA